MATKIRTWQITEGELKPIESTLADEGRREDYDLEAWIASNPDIVASDLAIIGRQVTTRSGPLDLLAIDGDGNLVVIELKRDILPREALARAIDYASDVADWNLEKISAVCLKYTQKALEDTLDASFPDLDLETLNINEAQRIILVGFSIESALERMITWLSSSYDVSINAVLLHYVRTTSGDELLTKTSIISEEVEQESTRRRKFKIVMSDEPGEYEDDELSQRVKDYLSKDLYSAQRIRTVLLPVCLEGGTVTRDALRQEFVTRGEADSIRQAGYFLSLISNQIGMEKNAFLRQVISYEYPTHEWEKDNYAIREEYKDLVAAALEDLKK